MAAPPVAPALTETLSAPSCEVIVEMVGALGVVAGVWFVAALAVPAP